MISIVVDVHNTNGAFGVVHSTVIFDVVASGGGGRVDPN
jgi:hypothetical protein